MLTHSHFTSYMSQALEEAKRAGENGEIPVGAVIVDTKGNIIAKAGNQTRALSDPSAHAEILAIRHACKAVTNERLNGFHIYVTLEPCVFCAGIISAARIARLYYGASDPKTGGVEHGARVFDHPQCHHRPEIYPAIGEHQSEMLLRNFFAKKRSQDNT